MSLGTFALRNCAVCGKMKMMPNRMKRCYDCYICGYTKRNNPYRKAAESKVGEQG